jgi:hypothetical protein
MKTDPPAPDLGALRRYPPDDCDHGQTHCSDCDLPFEEHRRPDDYPGREFPMTDERCTDALIREAGRLQGIIDAQAARLAAVGQAVADNQWLKDIHGVTRANGLRPRGYCTGCHDKHPCDTISLLEDIEAALAGLSVNHTGKE